MCPQQENGSDCGVFVCLSMRFLLEQRLLKQAADERVGMGMKGVTVDAAKGRKDMLKLVEGFRKEGRRNSGAAGGGAGVSRSRSPFGRKGSGARSPSVPRVGD